MIARLLQVYVRERFADERFIDTVRRIGHGPFKEYVYAVAGRGRRGFDRRGICAAGGAL